MESNSFDTLSQAVNALTRKGYTENFEAGDKGIQAIYSKRTYEPAELTIVSCYRFEGMTDPEDQAAVFAIEARDGTKGTLVMSYSATHSQNEELIQQIPYQKE